MRYFELDPKRILAIQSDIKNVKSDTSGPLNYAGYKYNSVSEFKKLCLNKCPVSSPTAVYNRVLYDKDFLTTQPEKYGGAADYDLYCRLADQGILIFPTGRYLGYNYRWHEGQATWKVQKESTNYDLKIQDFWRKAWKT